MEKDTTFAEELAKDLKRKAARKYVLIALALVIVVSTVVGLNIEGKDSKLPDGQGNIVNNEQVEDSGAVDKPNPQDLAVDNSEDPTASNEGNSAYKPETPQPVTVTISIKCDTLSGDISKLANSSIEEYIPSDGVVLQTITYSGTTDNTVFDVLNTVCRNNGIHMEASYTPMYESYYVEGINYLYEYDAGAGSGWMYKVNGWFPNYGCSSYYLSDGDVIEWLYTCDYGTDIGGKVF